MKTKTNNKSKRVDTKKNFYYFIWHKKSELPRYVICDIGNCASSDESFDMKFSELAHNEKVINLLNLLPFGIGRADGTRWFAAYLSAFSNNDENQYEKLMTDPIVRILICDVELRKKMKLIEGLVWNKNEPVRKSDSYKTELNQLYAEYGEPYSNFHKKHQKR